MLRHSGFNVFKMLNEIIIYLTGCAHLNAEMINLVYFKLGRDYYLSYYLSH